jgi:integrase
MLKIKTKFPGVRYRLHNNRKHGVQFDRCYFVRHRVDGKEIEEKVGWASHGETAKSAADLLAELSRNKTTGDGPRTLKEKRTLADTIRQCEIEQKRALAEAARIEQEENQPLKRVFHNDYLPYSSNNKKPKSIKTEIFLFENWISPVMGKKPLKGISVFDCERLKKRMRDAGKAEATVQYGLALLRQIYNIARKLKIYFGDNPVLEVEKPKFDNRKQRYLSAEDTERLMAALKKRNLRLYRMAMISLHAGLRFGEIVNLVWGDLNFDEGIILLRDPKNAENRFSFMTESLKAELKTMKPGKPSDPVFTGRNGAKLTHLSNTFMSVVAGTGMNADITDRRQQFTFHSLRHQFASNLVAMGADLYKVQLLLGHKTSEMTQRYSHMRPGDLRAAVNQLDDFMKKPEAGQVVSIERAESE